MKAQSSENPLIRATQRCLNLLFKACNETVLFPLRFSYLTAIVTPHIKKDSTVLDVGAARGRLAKTIQAQRKINCIGIDTHLQPNPLIPVIQYDGQNFPFHDKSFDCVLIIDVLHHTQSPDRVIKEAKRVARETILVKDHYWETALDHLLLRWADEIGNRPYGIQRQYNYLKLKSWQRLFEKNGLSIISSKKFRYNPFDPCKHVFFKLNVE